MTGPYFSLKRMLVITENKEAIHYYLIDINPMYISK